MNNFYGKSKFDLNNNPRLLNRIFLLFVMGCSAIVITKAIYSIIIGSSLNLVSGSWIGLAMDLSDGIFYRPLFSEAIGYGGTRFFPLYFSIHALLIKLFGMPIVSGHIVSICSGILLFSACFILFRQMKVKLIIAFILLSLLLSTSTIQLGLSTIRADILPVALNIIGIAFILSNYSTKYKIILASIFFTLAFSAKVTAIHGILSVFLWLILTKRIKEALCVLLFTFMGYILFFSVLYLGTSGRIISIFSSCASGGADLLTAIKAPIRFLKKVIKNDPICFLFSLWILFVSWKNKKDLVTNLFFIFWLVTIVITVFIFGSPGTNYNHLADFSTASILLIGSMWSFSKLPITKYFCMICIIISIAYNLLSVKLVFAGEDDHMGIRYPKEIIDVIRQNDAEVISENPMLPIIANKQPYLLDPFMFRLIFLKDENFRFSAINSINQKKYSAIIFMYDPLIDVKWYSDAHFGYDFIQAVIKNYKIGFKCGNYIVYIPSYPNSDWEKGGIE